MRDRGSSTDDATDRARERTHVVGTHHNPRSAG